MRTLASLFKALSDETRLLMLGLLLREGELCVCDFVEVLGVTQSKASRHLRYLVNAGLLQDRRDGVWVYFSLPAKPGAVQRTVLASLQRILPDHIPRNLVNALKRWRKRKDRCGVAWKPASRSRHTQGGRK